MKLFIAGGAGFIGSHLVEHFLAQPVLNKVVIYDNFCSGSRNHLADIKNHPKVAIVEGDLRDLGYLTHAMQGSELVVHLAANADIAKAVSQPDIDFWEGTYLTQNILEAMRITNSSKIIYTSGSGVYGEVPGTAFHETFGPCLPISAYGASKIACEALISAYCHMFGFKGRAFRMANVVGSRQTHGVGYDFVRRLMVNPLSLRILGDGTQSKSYIHIEDVISAMVIGHREVLGVGKPFDVFNVATDDYITVTEIANLACRVCNLDPDSVKFEYTGGDRGWAGDVPKVEFNVEKLKSLGWQCNRPSREAIVASLTSMFSEIGAGNL